MVGESSWGADLGGDHGAGLVEPFDAMGSGVSSQVDVPDHFGGGDVDQGLHVRTALLVYLEIDDGALDSQFPDNDRLLAQGAEIKSQADAAGVSCQTHLIHGHLCSPLRISQSVVRLALSMP